MKDKIEFSDEQEALYLLEHYVKEIKEKYPHLDFNIYPKWISVKEKLPKDGEEVLIYKPIDENISIGYRKNEYFFDLIDFTMEPSNVTDWMPLPAAPKDK